MGRQLANDSVRRMLDAEMWEDDATATTAASTAEMDSLEGDGIGNESDEEAFEEENRYRSPPDDPFYNGRGKLGEVADRRGQSQRMGRSEPNTPSRRHGWRARRTESRRAQTKAASATSRRLGEMLPRAPQSHGRRRQERKTPQTHQPGLDDPAGPHRGRAREQTRDNKQRGPVRRQTRALGPRPLEVPLRTKAAATRTLEGRQRHRKSR